MVESWNTAYETFLFYFFFCKSEHMNLVGHPKDRDQNSFEMTSDLIISVFITSVNQNLNHEFFFLNFFFFFVILGH
jgi:hypothetical protein